jgi:hypothetical protein
VAGGQQTAGTHWSRFQPNFAQWRDTIVKLFPFLPRCCVGPASAVAVASFCLSSCLAGHALARKGSGPPPPPPCTTPSDLPRCDAANLAAANQVAGGLVATQQQQSFETINTISPRPSRSNSGDDLAISASHRDTRAHQYGRPAERRRAAGCNHWPASHSRLARLGTAARSFQRRATAWLQVRVLPGPPRNFNRLDLNSRTSQRGYNGLRP